MEIQLNAVAAAAKCELLFNKAASGFLKDD
jgi:hypothetical protein